MTNCVQVASPYLPVKCVAKKALTSRSWVLMHFPLLLWRPFLSSDLPWNILRRNSLAVRWLNISIEMQEVFTTNVLRKLFHSESPWKIQTLSIPYFLPTIQRPLNRDTFYYSILLNILSRSRLQKLREQIGLFSKVLSKGSLLILDNKEPFDNTSFFQSTSKYLDIWWNTLPCDILLQKLINNSWPKSLPKHRWNVTCMSFISRENTNRYLISELTSEFSAIWLVERFVLWRYIHRVARWIKLSTFVFKNKMAASRFAQVSDEEISEMKINAVPKSFLCSSTLKLY